MSYEFNLRSPPLLKDEDILDIHLNKPHLLSRDAGFATDFQVFQRQLKDVYIPSGYPEGTIVSERKEIQCDLYRFYRWRLIEFPRKINITHNVTATITSGATGNSKEYFERALNLEASAGINMWAGVSLKVKMDLRMTSSQEQAWDEKKEIKTEYTLEAGKTYARWCLFDEIEIEKRTRILNYYYVGDKVDGLEFVSENKELIPVSAVLYDYGDVFPETVSSSRNILITNQTPFNFRSKQDFDFDVNGSISNQNDEEVEIEFFVTSKGCANANIRWNFSITIELLDKEYKHEIRRSEECVVRGGSATRIHKFNLSRGTRAVDVTIDEIRGSCID